MSDRATVAEIASQYLPPDVAARWLRLLRPAAALSRAGPDDQVAGVLGGQPWLPDAAEWPTWDNRGPLAFIASVDCAALAAVPLDITLPPAGMVLFFYFDGQYDNYEATVGYWEPATSAGARVLYVPPGVRTSAQACPAGIIPYERVELAVEAAVTFPGFEHPDLQDAFMAPGEDLRSFLRHPVNADAFTRALAERRPGPRHHVGGYADPIQGPVEYEVAVAALGGRDPGNGRLAAEQARWALLAQFDSDDRTGMMWGDCGALYWLSRREDLAAGRITNASFTWQCS